MLERLQSFATGDSVQTHVEREVSLDGSLRWYQWTDRAFTDSAGEVVEYQSVGHDVTDQRRAAEFTAHQAEILEQVARGVPLEETLLTIASALEGHFPRFSCAIMLLDSESSTLRVGAAPTLAPRFLEGLEGTPVSAIGGSCGAAALLREPVYVRDVATDDRWIDHRELAETHGLHASWSIPIVSSDGDAVLGTLDVFVAEPRLPDEEHRQVFFLLAQLASIAIERKAFEERLAHQSMHDPAHRAAESVAVPRPARSGDRAVPAHEVDRRCRVPRPRPLQEHQREHGPRRRRRAARRACARKLETVIRPGDTVARFGGDEFTVLCEDLSADSARELAVEIAERLLTSCDPPDGRARDRDVRRRERRHRTRDVGRRAPRRSAPRRRRRDVPRQGVGARPSRSVRRPDANPRADRALDRERAAPRARAGRVPPLLPTDRVAVGREVRRRGGAAALAASRTEV